MSTRYDHVQTGKGWVLCLVILVAALYIALEDTTHLISIAPYLLAVAFILGRATFSSGDIAPPGIRHGRLTWRHGAAPHSFEIILARIDPQAFYPYWNDRRLGRLQR